MPSARSRCRGVVLHVVEKFRLSFHPNDGPMGFQSVKFVTSDLFFGR
jgi:hypothetical protein